MNPSLSKWLFVFLGLTLGGIDIRGIAAEMSRIVVSEDKKGFVYAESSRRFEPIGFNYDRDFSSRLLEDYWDKEWPAVESHFRAMAKLGANVVRVHLQFGRFMDGPKSSNEKALDRLGRLVSLAEECGLYLDVTGLGCYHKQDVPAWYDQLNEEGRWNAQAEFWRAIASRCAKSPAIFCYDLMNEPVVPGGRRAPGDWLGPGFAGKHYVQCISLDQADRPRPEVAKLWIHQLATAIRQVDPHHLITVGLVDWSLDRPGLTSGFVPDRVAGDLDFLCVHLYPEAGKVDEAIKTLQGFQVGKPVVIEETFPLKCSREDFEQFLDRSQPLTAGWITFYWGKPIDELRKSKDIGDLLLVQALELFQKRVEARAR